MNKTETSGNHEKFLPGSFLVFFSIKKDLVLIAAIFIIGCLSIGVHKYLLHGALQTDIAYALLLSLITLPMLAMSLFTLATHWSSTRWSRAENPFLKLCRASVVIRREVSIPWAAVSLVKLVRISRGRTTDEYLALGINDEAVYWGIPENQRQLLTQSNESIKKRVGFNGEMLLAIEITRCDQDGEKIFSMADAYWKAG